MIALLVLFVGGGVYLIALGNEFVGLSLIVIYAGAVAVLFMFVIFTVNLSVEQVYRQHIKPACGRELLWCAPSSGLRC